jgi:hypothetical protein
MADQQVRATRGCLQLLVAVTQRRHQQVPQNGLGACSRIHDPGDRRLIVGIDVRPYRRELEAFAFDGLAIKLGHGKYRTMTTLGQDPGDADVGKDIPI